MYNVLGQEVRTLIEGEVQDAGYKQVEWDARQTEGGQASALPSGVYFYRITAETRDNPSTGSGQRFTDVKKMILTK